MIRANKRLLLLRLLLSPPLFVEPPQIQLPANKNKNKQIWNIIEWLCDSGHKYSGQLNLVRFMN